MTINKSKFSNRNNEALFLVKNTMDSYGACYMRQIRDKRKVGVDGYSIKLWYVDSVNLDKPFDAKAMINYMNYRLHYLGLEAVYTPANGNKASSLVVRLKENTHYHISLNPDREDACLVEVMDFEPDGDGVKVVTTKDLTQAYVFDSEKIAIATLNEYLRRLSLSKGPNPSERDKSETGCVLLVKVKMIKHPMNGAV